MKNYKIGNFIKDARIAIFQDLIAELLANGMRKAKVDSAEQSRELVLRRVGHWAEAVLPQARPMQWQKC